MKKLVFLAALVLLSGLVASACEKTCQPGQDIDCWIDALKNPEMAEKAVENLHDLGDKKAEPALIEAFKGAEDRPELREKIAEIFNKWGTQAALDPMLQAIDYAVGPDKEGRKAKRTNLMNRKLASALGALGDSKAVQPLLRLMKATKSPDVQRAAIRGLAKLKAREVVDDLIKLSEDTTVNKLIRMNAIYALGEIGDPKAVDSLVLSLYRDKAFYFFQAGLALVKIGEPAIPQLVRTMNGANLEAKQMIEGNIEILEGALEANAAKVLGDIGSPEGVEPLLEMIKKVEKWEAETNQMLTVTRLINALGAIGDKRGLEPPVKYLAKEFWDVRTVCASAINYISDRTVVTTLLKYSSEGSHPKTRAPLIEAIGNLGTDEALPALEKMKETQKDLTVQEALKLSLERLEAYKQCQTNVSCWTEKLSSPSAAVREKAAYELGRLGDDKALDALLKVMRDDAENVRFAVMWAMDKLGAKKAIPEIERLVEEEKDSARFKVANFNFQLVAARLSRRGH